MPLKAKQPPLPSRVLQFRPSPPLPSPPPTLPPLLSKSLYLSRYFPNSDVPSGPFSSAFAVTTTIFLFLPPEEARGAVVDPATGTPGGGGGDAATPWRARGVEMPAHRSAHVRTKAVTSVNQFGPTISPRRDEKREILHGGGAGGAIGNRASNTSFRSHFRNRAIVTLVGRQPRQPRPSPPSVDIISLDFLVCRKSKLFPPFFLSRDKSNEKSDKLFDEIKIIRRVVYRSFVRSVVIVSVFDVWTVISSFSFFLSSFGERLFRREGGGRSEFNQR